MGKRLQNLIQNLQHLFRVMVILVNCCTALVSRAISLIQLRPVSAVHQLEVFLRLLVVDNFPQEAFLEA